jgi:hypothetical protein
MPLPERAHPARNSIFWPLSTVLLGVLMIVLLLTSPPQTPLAQEDTPTETPTSTETATVTNTNTPSPYPSNTPEPTTRSYPYPAQTVTARSLTQTAQRTDTPTPEPEEEPETAPPRLSNAQQPTATDTREPNTPTDTDVPTQRATNTPDNVTPTITNTPTLTPEANTLVCPSGETTLIEGIGPPNTALILYFEERPIIGTVVPKQPVGGTTSDNTGFYSIPLKVRTGKIGEFLVRVETRDRNILVRELICNVPQPTPGL